MSTSPLYRRGDSVYLRSSAEIGKLEAFRVSSAKQTQEGRWVYGIDITKKPPHQGLVGDTYDSRTKELDLFYTEGEIIDICEALDIICERFRRKVTFMESRLSSQCQESDAPEVGLDEPRWSINNVVYFDASARLGFLESTRIQEIIEVGVQPGSRRTKYRYKVRNTNPKLTFREDELITSCEALEKAIQALQRDLASAEAKQAELCI